LIRSCYCCCYIDVVAAVAVEAVASTAAMSVAIKGNVSSVANPSACKVDVLLVI